MLKNTILVVLLTIVFFIIDMAAYPSFTTKKDEYKQFSISKAVSHIQKISSKPGYLGTHEQHRSRSYIVKQLQQMGLTVNLQKTHSMRVKNSIVSAPVINIIAKLEGTDKQASSLLLMSHYDDAAYASPGASDSGAGVAVILETLRAYLKQDKKPVNDIIILITDAEEQGLLGAYAFAQQHHWAKNIGLVLNFDARGTSGPAYMLAETKTGNAALIKTFAKTATPFPVSNSIAYEIYKILPNDTDMTALKDTLDIQGYNFAFIDNHFNYHTKLDNSNNISLDSLAHQATYATHLLEYFSQSDLRRLQSEDNHVFFSIPVIGLIHYPESWSQLITIITAILFLFFVASGFYHKKIDLKAVFTSAVYFISVLATTLLITKLILILIKYLHPEFNNILQGFPYNGYSYIYGILTASAIITIIIYAYATQGKRAKSLALIPVTLWVILTLYCSFAIPGASYLNIFALCALAVLISKIYSSKLSDGIDLLLMIGAFLLLIPLILSVPVALGLNMVWVAVIVLIMGMTAFASVVSTSRFLSLHFVLFILPIWFFYKAEKQAVFSPSQPIPSSLNYWIDSDKQQAYWTTNNRVLSQWNSEYFNHDSEKKSAEFKQWKKQNYQRATQRAPAKTIETEKAKISVQSIRQYTSEQKITLSVYVPEGTYKFRILPQKNMRLNNLTLNKSVASRKSMDIEAHHPLLTHYMGRYDRQINLELTLPPNTNLPELAFIFYIPELHETAELSVPPRPENEMPMAFVDTDLIIIKQLFKLPNNQ